MKHYPIETEIEPMDSNQIQLGYLLNLKDTLRKIETKEISLHDVDDMILNGMFG